MYVVKLYHAHMGQEEMLQTLPKESLPKITFKLATLTANGERLRMHLSCM